jgi:hypothetical protein
VVLLMVAACGSTSGGSGRQDAAVDTQVPQVDANIDVAAQFDAAAPDGPTCGTFQTLTGCDVEMTACTTADVENSDECGGDLDCVQSELFTRPMCLRKCNCTAECPPSSFCYPAKLTDYTSSGVASSLVGKVMGHCFLSLCGQGAISNSSIKNGDLLGPCKLGGEAFIKPGKVDTRDGTCLPIATDWPLGECLPGGTSPRGGECSFDTTGCTDPATFVGCKPGALCIGHQGEATGWCAKTCDPSTEGFDPTAPGSCAADTEVTYDQFCQDSSSYYRPTPDPDAGVELGELTPAYVGFCTDLHACDALAASNQCDGVVWDGGVAWNNCEPTTPLNPFGLCTPSGSVAAEADCDADNLCQPGYICLFVAGATQGSCRQFCGLAENGPSDAGLGEHPCPADQFCGQVLTEEDPTPESDPNDDILSLNWGGCLPITDGGVPDA